MAYLGLRWAHIPFTFIFIILILAVACYCNSFKSNGIPHSFQLDQSISVERVVR